MCIRYGKVWFSLKSKIRCIYKWPWIRVLASFCFIFHFIFFFPNNEESQNLCKSLCSYLRLSTFKIFKGACGNKTNFTGMWIFKSTSPIFVKQHLPHRICKFTKIVDLNLQKVRTKKTKQPLWNSQHYQISKFTFSTYLESEIRADLVTKRAFGNMVMWIKKSKSSWIFKKIPVVIEYANSWFS